MWKAPVNPIPISAFTAWNEINKKDNNIVKNFFKYYAKKVNKLKRISIGCINLGELETGKTSKLDYNEVMNLKKQIQIKES